MKFKYANIIKGLLIVTVTWGHSISMCNSLRNVQWYDSPLNVFFTSFEMPLFILISGFFLHISLEKHSLKEVLRKRVVAVVPVLLFWVCIPTIISFCSSKNMVFLGGGRELLKLLWSNIFYGDLWYLSSYLTCSILVLAMELITRKSKNNIYVEAFLFFVVFLGVHIFTVVPSLVTSLFSFFCTGYFVSKYKLLNKVNDVSTKNIIYIFCTFCILYFGLYIKYDSSLSIYILNPYLHSAKDLFILVYRFVLAISGCIVFSCVGIFVKNSAIKIGKGVEILGGKTLQIYILSMYIQKKLQLLLIQIPNSSDLINNRSIIICSIIFEIVLILTCIVVDRIIMNIPFVHKFLLE